MNPNDIRREVLADYVLGMLEPDELHAVETALEGSEELSAEVAWLRLTLLSLPEGLEPESLPPGAWQALRARLDAPVPDATPASIGTEPGTDQPVAPTTVPATVPTTVPPSMPTAVPSPMPRVGPRTAGAGTAGPRTADPRAAGPKTARPEPRARPRRRSWAPFLPAAFAAVLLVGVATWGGIQARNAATLEREQRIVAYWMRDPDIRILHLEQEGALTAGIVCILPDGRAMVLQPGRAPAGSSYVVYGVSDAGDVALAEGRGRLLLFRAEGLRRVSLAVRGRTDATVGSVSLQ